MDSTNVNQVNESVAKGIVWCDSVSCIQTVFVRGSELKLDYSVCDGSEFCLFLLL